MTVQASVAHLNSSDPKNMGHNRINPIKSIGIFFTSIRRANASSVYFKQLSALPVSELDRMGIRREDLPKIAYERYFGELR